jgi:hypothetical protein
MSQPKSTHKQPKRGLPRRRGRTMGLAVALGGSLVLGAAVAGADQVAAAAASRSSSPTVMHLYQVQTAQTFYNASGSIIQGYPPVGGHVKFDDIDYVGDRSHHARAWTVTDHTFCNVVAAPATADCFYEFATGDSLIYIDNITINLASTATSDSFHIDGGTGRYAGYSGTVASTSAGNNSDLVLSLHKG